MARKRKIAKHEVAQKANNSEEIALTGSETFNEEALEEVVAEFTADPDDLRRDKFLSYLILGLAWKVAAEKAGFSSSYARGPLYQAFKKSPGWRKKIDQIVQRVPQKYRRICMMRLGLVSEIEHRAMKLMLDNPELALKHPGFLKQQKQVSGLLQDEQQTPLVINYGYMQQVMQATTEGKKVTWGSPDEHGMCRVIIHAEPGELEIVDAEAGESTN